MRYEGTFIGGVRDGGVMRHHANFFEVAERAPFKFLDPGVTAVMESLKITRYLFVSYKDHVGFWVPDDKPQTMDYVIEQLCIAYWHYASLKH